MPWTIILQEQNNFGQISMVEAKPVVIETEVKRKGKPPETINIKVGANVFIHNDSWKADVSLASDNLQGCIKVFYSTPHGTYTIQWPHRLDVNPHNGERKMEAVKTTGLTASKAARKLAENNIPAALIQYVLDVAFQAGQKKKREAA